MKIYTYDNKVMTIGGKWMEQPAQPGPGPGPTLPPYTIRLKFTEGVTPTFELGTAVQVSSSPNVWDLTYESVNNSWGSLLWNQTNLIEVIDANTTGITDMTFMFEGCASLTTVALFDTSSVTDMGGMFTGCSNITTVPLFDTSSVTAMNNMFINCESLTSIPLFDTSNVTNMFETFRNCYSLTSIPLFDTSSCTNMYQTFKGCINVQSGAYALYQQASTQATPPVEHYDTFYSCGSNTITGAAELDQIPTSWGGTMTDPTIEFND